MFTFSLLSAIILSPKKNKTRNEIGCRDNLFNYHCWIDR